jgi:TetR/AcrR family transcriptional regulator, lmrAB and yxaGH operons repressor
MMVVIAIGALMAGDSRDKMVQSAASLIGQRGMNAASFSDVLADSGAPRGSIYHHFPEGKKQLAECAMRLTSDQILGHMQACIAITPQGVLEHFVGLFRHVIVTSNATAGCAIAGVTIDVGDGDEDLLCVARVAFQSWVSTLAAQLERTGVEKLRAQGVATICIASVEGALILCRAEGNDAPLRLVESQLVELVRTPV